MLCQSLSTLLHFPSTNLESLPHFQNIGHVLWGRFANNTYHKKTNKWYQSTCAVGTKRLHYNHSLKREGKNTSLHLYVKYISTNQDSPRKKINQPSVLPWYLDTSLPILFFFLVFQYYTACRQREGNWCKHDLARTELAFEGYSSLLRMSTTSSFGLLGFVFFTGVLEWLGPVNSHRSIRSSAEIRGDTSAFRSSSLIESLDFKRRKIILKVIELKT